MADYYAQINPKELDSHVAFRDWTKARCDEARNKNAAYGLRLTEFPDEDMVIIEGWEKDMREYPEPHLYKTLQT